MHLGRSGEAYFVSDVPSDSGGASPGGPSHRLPLYAQRAAWARG